MPLLIMYAYKQQSGMFLLKNVITNLQLILNIETTLWTEISIFIQQNMYLEKICHSNFLEFLFDKK